MPRVFARCWKRDCHLADLAHRTCHGVDIIEDRGLDRVHHHQAGLQFFDLSEDRVARSLGQQQEVGAEAVDPACSQGDLFG